MAVPQVGTGAAAADSMAAGTVGGQPRLTAPPGRATLFGPPRPCDAGGEQAEEQPAEHFAAHDPLTECAASGTADRVEQPIPQQRLFHDRNSGFFGLVAQR